MAEFFYIISLSNQESVYLTDLLWEDAVNEISNRAGLDKFPLDGYASYTRAEYLEDVGGEEHADANELAKRPLEHIYHKEYDTVTKQLQTIIDYIETAMEDAGGDNDSDDWDDEEKESIIDLAGGEDNLQLILDQLKEAKSTITTAKQQKLGFHFKIMEL